MFIYDITKRSYDVFCLSELILYDTILKQGRVDLDVKLISNAA